MIFQYQDGLDSSLTEDPSDLSQSAQVSQTLPPFISFTLDLKPSVRKTLGSFAFTIERQNLSWETLLSEIQTIVSSKKLDLDVELNKDTISRILKFFSSSRCNIAGATHLTKENMLPLFEATYRNYVAFLRKENSPNSTFKIRLLLLLSEINNNFTSTFYPDHMLLTHNESFKKKQRNNDFKKSINMKWPHFDSRMQSSPQGSSTGASLPNSIRFNCIMETQYGTKRQQCALEVSIPDILEAYKIIEPHLLYASNLNNSSTSSQVSQSADLNIDHNQSDLSSLQIPRQNH